MAGHWMLTSDSPRVNRFLCRVAGHHWATHVKMAIRPENTVVEVDGKIVGAVTGVNLDGSQTTRMCRRCDKREDLEDA